MISRSHEVFELAAPWVPPRYVWVKRWFDVAVSSAALLLLSPVLVLIAILVRLDSPGPAIFRQLRVGKDGRLFEMWKFRTMDQGATDEWHRRLVVPLVRGAVSAPPGQSLSVLPSPADDPRITRSGRWL